MIRDATIGRDGAVATVVLRIWRQRPHLPSRLGPSVRQPLRQYGLRRIPGHRRVHVRPRSRQLRGGNLGRSAIPHSTERRRPGLRLLRAGNRRDGLCPAGRPRMARRFLSGVHPQCCRLVRALLDLSRRAVRADDPVARSDHGAHGRHPDAAHSPPAPARRDGGGMEDRRPLRDEYGGRGDRMLPYRLCADPSARTALDGGARRSVEPRGRLVRPVPHSSHDWRPRDEPAAPASSAT
jgi:hypothetical protein